MSNRNGINPNVFHLMNSLYAPDDTTYQDAWAKRQEELAAEAEALANPPQPQNDGFFQRSAGELVGDLGSGLAKGVNSVGGAIVQTGDASVELNNKFNPLMSVMKHYFPERVAESEKLYTNVAESAGNFFKGGEEYWQDNKSQKIQDDAEYVSGGKGFFDTAGRAIERPQAIPDLVADSAAYMLPGGWAARALAATGATKTAVTTGSMGVGALLDAGATGMQAKREALQLLGEKTPEQLMVESPDYKALRDGGISHNDAVLAMGREAGFTAQAIQLPISFLASKFTGAGKIESDFFTGQGVKNFFSAIARETAEEGIQESSAQVATNIGIQQNADESRSLTQDVGKNAALGMIAGGAQAGGMKALGAFVPGSRGTAQNENDDGTGAPIDGQLQTNVDTTTHIPSVDEIGIVDDLPPASPLISTGDQSNPDDRFKFELNTESLRTRIQNLRAKRREEMNRVNRVVDFAPVEIPAAQPAEVPAQNIDAIEFAPPEISQPEKFTLAPAETNYSNGVDFAPQESSRTNDLAAGVEQAISKNIDSARSARMPENLKDTRLLRNRYRTHLTNVADSLEPNAGSFSSPDSLLDMVAKNGGLNAAAWAQEGIDPADAKLVNNANYAKAFRNEGGMTPDDVAEFAAQRGFSGFANAQGAPDANAALNAINEELAGKKRYSAEDETALQAAQAAPAYISELKEFGSPEAIKRAITLALEGKNLGENQLRIVQEVLNNTNAHSRDDKTIKEKWADRAKTMLANRGNKELNSWRNRDEHTADATTHEAALNEIMTDAIENYGIDPDAVKNAYRTYAEKYPTQGQLTAAMTSWVSANKPNTSEHLSYERQNRKAELSGRSPSQRGAALPGAGLSPESESRQEASKPRSDAPSTPAEPRSDSAGRDAGLRQPVDSGTDENQLPPLAEGFEKSLLRARPLAKKLGIPNYNQMRLAELVPAIRAKYSEKPQAEAQDNQEPIKNEKPVTAIVSADSVEINQEPVKEKPKSIEGKNIDGDWAEFSDASESLKIPRAEMPQIKAEHRGAMVNFLNARGVEHQEENVPSDSLKPTQTEFSREKVAKAKGFEGGNRSILISSDNHVLDGHHQWMAARDNGEDVKVIRLDAPIKKLVDLAHEFPSSTTDAASEQDQSTDSSESLATTESKQAEKGKLLYKLETETAKSISRESAQAVIDRISKNWKVKVKINLISSIDELPDSVKSRLHKTDDEQGEPAALIDESTGHVYINLSKAASERSIEELIFHEVYTHFGLRQLMGAKVSGLMTRLYLNLGKSQFDAMAKKYDVNTEAYREAYKEKPEEYVQAILAEELLAHMAEHPRPAIVRITNEFVGAVRAWLRESGFMELASISENDMRYLLKQSRETVTKGKQGNITGLIYSLAGISKSDRKTINAERNRAAVDEPQDSERNVNEDLITMWATISRDTESFKLPFSRKKDFVEIADDLEKDNNFKTYEAPEFAEMSEHGAEKSWRIAIPEKGKAAVYQKGNKVWIDVSDLEQGDGGKRIYNIAANYAFNNGLTFMGDPAGLKLVAQSRRLENMLSSALKFGTTDHLQPHKLQLISRGGVPALKWKKGDTENNILEMIRASYESVKNQFPEIENMVYNPETSKFQYRDSGKEVTKDDLNNLAAAARAFDGGTDSSVGNESGGDSSSGKITAGRTTIERAILTGSILRGTSSEVSRLLDKLSEQRSERLTGDNAILYSLPNTETRSQGGFSVSGLQENKNTFGISVDGILRVWQDKMRPLLRTQQAIKKDGGGISENENAYLAEEAFHGKTENDLRKMRERFLEPMSKKMADSNIEREELDMYLWAKHAEERNAQIAKINSEMPDGGSGMTNAQAKQILKQAKTDGKQAILDDLAGTVYALLAEKRKIARYLSGDEVVDTWNSVYQHYVPLKGRAVDDSGADFPRVGSGFDIRGSESLRALGRRTKPESPTLHAIKDTTEAIIRYRKNEVGNALLALVEANPNPEYWEAHDASSPDFERKLLKKAGKEYVGQAKVINKEDYFITKREGKEFYIRLEDPMLLRAMKNMGPEKMNWAVQHLAKASRFLSAMCTSYNPEFVITNFARDIQTAIINLQAEIDLHDGKVKGKQITGKMIKGVPFAMRSVYASLKGKRLTGDLSEWQKYFDDFRNDGANTGWFQLQDIDQQADELETLINSQKKNAVGFALRLKKKIGDFVANANGAVESAIRLSVYKSAIEAGVSRKQAASLAKNLTVNFNRKGEIGASMNAAYMFFNAAVQGTASLARALGTLKIDADGKRSLNMAQKVALGVMVAAFGLAVLNRSAAGDDDDDENWWDKVPAHEKERNIIIMKAVLGGPKDGTYWKIPLPYGYNIFSAIPVSAEGAVNGKKGVGEASGEILKAVLGAFSPIGVAKSETLAGGVTRTLAPTVLKPLADLTANENFFGSKIFAENMDFDTAKPNSHLSMRSTNVAWKWIAEALNDNTGGSAYRSGVIDISPDKMGYIFNYFVGSAGAFYSTAVHDGIKLSEGREIKTKEIPFVRRLSGAVDWHKDQNIFYERKEELEQIRDEYKGMPFGVEKTNFFERYRDEIQLAARAKSASVSLSHVRKQKNRINDNPSLSDKQKDEALDPLDLRMKGTVDRFNALYSDKLNR